MGNFGIGEMAVIAIFGLLVFGPQRLPEIARSIGGFVREFKNVTNSFTNELKLEVDAKPKPKSVPASAVPVEAKVSTGTAEGHKAPDSDGAGI
ncbi:TatA/E family twin arginine-targeting protein translocase [soil metagenome]